MKYILPWKADQYMKYFHEEFSFGMAHECSVNCKMVSDALSVELSSAREASFLKGEPGSYEEGKVAIHRRYDP